MKTYILILMALVSFVCFGTITPGKSAPAAGQGVKKENTPAVQHVTVDNFLKLKKSVQTLEKDNKKIFTALKDSQANNQKLIECLKQKSQNKEVETTIKKINNPLPFELKSKITIDNSEWYMDDRFKINLAIAILNTVLVALNIFLVWKNLRFANKQSELTKFEIDKSVALIQPIFKFKFNETSSQDCMLKFDAYRSSLCSSHISAQIVPKMIKDDYINIKFKIDKKEGTLTINNISDNDFLSNLKNKDYSLKISYRDQLFCEQYQLYRLELEEGYDSRTSGLKLVPYDAKYFTGILKKYSKKP